MRLLGWLDTVLHRYADWCYPVWRPLCDRADDWYRR